MTRARRVSDTSPHVSNARLRGLDRGVDVGALGQQHLGLLLARGGIPHGRRAGGRAGRLAAADPVLDRPELHCGHGVTFCRGPR